MLAWIEGHIAVRVPKKIVPKFQHHFMHTRIEIGNYGENDREKLVTVEGTLPEVKEEALIVIGMLQQ